MKKTKSLSRSLFWICCFILVSGAYAQETGISPKAETLRGIAIERAEDSSTVSIQIDPISSPDLSLSEIRVAGKVNQSGKLRSLSIRFCADSSFVPSGEAELILSDEKKLTLYSSSIQRVNEPEKTNYTLTFLDSLDAVLSDTVAISESMVFMNLFSKKNKTARLGIALEFFKLLNSPQR